MVRRLRKLEYEILDDVFPALGIHDTRNISVAGFVEGCSSVRRALDAAVRSLEGSSVSCCEKAFIRLAETMHDATSYAGE